MCRRANEVSVKWVQNPWYFWCRLRSPSHCVISTFTWSNDRDSDVVLPFCGKEVIGNWRYTREDKDNLSIFTRRSFFSHAKSMEYSLCALTHTAWAQHSNINVMCFDVYASIASVHADSCACNKICKISERAPQSSYFYCTIKHYDTLSICRTFTIDLLQLPETICLRLDDWRPNMWWVYPIEFMNSYGDKLCDPAEYFWGNYPCVIE